ncbi:MAG: hypothetical protein BWY99_02853 [Synergistetes bacterium ADurb.BinA166]|nr:MAG: hypothetical protein BWY99_02853 [Synergistetes bacterium ADurb.BinA166]
MFLVSASIMPTVYSATAFALWCGVWITGIPRFVASSRSMFSSPPRAETISFSFFALWMISLHTGQMWTTSTSASSTIWGMASG